METIIETKNLTKSYGKNRGIINVNLKVGRGEIFGFLGPNGAGKSTTIRTLLDFIRPTSGSATIFGMDCQQDTVAIKNRLSYIPGDVSLYGNMTGKRFLEYFGSIRGRYDEDKVRDLSARFDIGLDRKMKEYSKGMRQKVALIQAFMNDPDLIIMDEATSGLDPLVQQTFNDVVKEEVRDGKTIFMSSHILSEVEKVCERVAIIREGSIVAEENVEDLRRKSGKVIEVKFADRVEEESLKALGIGNLSRHNGYYRMTVTGNIQETLQELTARKVADINIHPMTLEDIFMQYYAGGK
ncbi:ABC transporter ATP-binding protein [Methanocella sp. CWC-04]|uniref:ABC transporter ATP-binding protein n=1 Tax=Methanooceanicella nereidis TaxID=2052831 RepID=A0AAP2RAX7_9EURY|nr:ABC transporter ATP-binding protein [Methanocella sp. CWC-04]MCD1293677.1 ABC transporter ATP-binding protein [Methanocella sp. CWC-04]